jgi:hypothetical protein
MLSNTVKETVDLPPEAVKLPPDRLLTSIRYVVSLH